MQQHVEAIRHILTTHATCYDVKTPTFLVALEALQWKLQVVQRVSNLVACGDTFFFCFFLLLSMFFLLSS
jgi:hypothetical protein